MKILPIILFLFFNGMSYLFGQEVAFGNIPTWQEEFNYSGKANPDIWSYIKGPRGRELEYYTDNESNLRVNKGYLTITPIKEEIGGYHYSSARIHTRYKRSFLYGKLEVKAKLPTGKGIWPAIWMVPVKYSNFPMGEIDIMEYIECFNGKKFQANVHTIREKQNRVQHGKLSENIDVTQFHVYGLEWYKDRLVFTIDNKPFHEYKKQDPHDWAFDKEYYLILNVAYGGWGGSCGLDDSIFPCEMQVDWIRYYELKE